MGKTTTVGVLVGSLRKDSINRKLAKALAGLAPRPAAGAATNAAPDRVVSRFRLGPFFEYRATSGGGTYWALRPLFSRVDDPVADTCVTDLAWPRCGKEIVYF